ncbi:MAG: glycoside hydrolase family 28 protein [Rikenellaceae bacterium]|jgi:polygalacturonase|nr:glycoside hydrolase family 28 protein [Rikenellaceae bacterium]
MKKFTFLALAAALLAGCCEKQEGYKYEYLYQNLQFDMPRVERPVFADRTVKITDFGGVGDGIAMNTDAFARAMESLSSQGGGTLVVPAGVWYTGPITVSSNVNLHLDKGALVLFNPELDLYPIIDTWFEGWESKRCTSPINARGAENIAITGEGAFDGSGHMWRGVGRDRVNSLEWAWLGLQGGTIENDRYVPNGNRTRIRPVMVSLIECKNVLLEDVLVQNSPNWTIHPLFCENLIIDGLTVRNPSWAANGDGLDIESCKNVIVVDCTLDVGDDGVCIKSGKDKQGRDRGRPTENVLVDNCTVFKAHGGFVVGSEMSGGVRNVSVTNCKFLGTDVGLRFKSRRGRGGVVENIYASNLSMVDLATEAVLFDLYYVGMSAAEVLAAGIEPGDKDTDPIPAVTEETPAFRNIYIKDVSCRNAYRAFYFNGLPEMNITNVNLENCSITAVYGGELCESDGVNLKDIYVEAQRGPALKLRNVKNLTLENYETKAGADTAFLIRGVRNANISLSSKTITAGNSQFDIEDTGVVTFK